MGFRVREILLVASPYDAFVLEEDRGLSETILSQYIDLNLRFVPRITRVSSPKEAFDALHQRTFDLILTMSRLAGTSPLEFGTAVKHLHPDKPVILLSVEALSSETLYRLRLSGTINKIFYWLGDSKILLAIIKYVEDLGNVKSDAGSGVQVILIVEDNPQFYSMFLPLVYTEIMIQTQRLISESVNDYQRLLRMQARPKIMLAESYEQAAEVVQTYPHNLLGLVSDVSFPRKDQTDPQAGFALLEHAKKKVPDLPVLLLSQEARPEESGQEHQTEFLHKNSPNLLSELRAFILRDLGFGDFVFRMPDTGAEICRANTLQEFERTLQDVPLASLQYHARRNDISKWLRARTEFEAAERIRPIKVTDFGGVEAMKEHLTTTVRQIIHANQAGAITDFRSYSDGFRNAFIRIGTGSLGGKARGIAFMNALLARTGHIAGAEQLEIRTPQTFVLCTDVFERFLESNSLHRFAIETGDDTRIADRFRDAPLPDSVTQNLRKILGEFRHPLAVRSSSVLEDSQNLPFAGLYATYMLPNSHPDLEVRLAQITDAIKLVYASTFFQASKEYMKNTPYRIEDERMAVIVQEVAGSAHGDIFYPAIAGLAQSHNFYPTPPLRASDGVAYLALGLGKGIVEGENSYRFSPREPKRSPPYSTTGEMLDASQRAFYCLDLSHPDVRMTTDQSCSLRREDLSRAEADGTLFYAASTVAAGDDRLRDTLSIDGIRVVTFANILKHRLIPLAEIIARLLDTGKESFGCDVEIEFAVDFHSDGDGSVPLFSFLQIRPLVVGREGAEVSVPPAGKPGTVCYSNHAMGNGVYGNIFDLIYVDPEQFKPEHSREIAEEIGACNAVLKQEGRNAVLIGVGRWGSSDTWLGIPVTWQQISAARVMVETELPNFHIDPSGGSHFFHNLISLRLGYLHVAQKEDFINWEWLSAQPPRDAYRWIRHIQTESPFTVLIDGHSSRGAVLGPEGKTLPPQAGYDIFARTSDRSNTNGVESQSHSG